MKKIHQNISWSKLRYNWKLIGLIFILIVTAPNYSQFLSPNFWFGLNSVRKQDRSINSLVEQLPEGRIAGTSRSLAYFGYKNELFDLAYWAVPYSQWPKDVNAAIIPTDIGTTKEWSLENLADAYLPLRSVLEAKGFHHVDDENGYQLWSKQGNVMNQDRLLRYIPASILDSDLPLLFSPEGSYREIRSANQNRTLVYGPYVNLIPGKTDIKLKANVSSWKSGNIFHVDLIRNGSKIFSKDISHEDWEVGNLISVPDDLIQDMGSYEIVIFVSPDFVGDAIKFFGYTVITKNIFLSTPETFYLRLNKECRAELPHYLLAGEYQLLDQKNIKLVSKTSRGFENKSENTFNLYNDGQRDKVTVQIGTKGECGKIAYLKINSLREVK